MKRIVILTLIALFVTGCSTWSRTITAANMATGHDPASNIGPLAQGVIAKLKADLERTGEMAAAVGGEPVGTRCSQDGLAAIANLPTAAGQANGLLSSAYLIRLWRLALESPLVQKAEDSCAPLLAAGQKSFFGVIKRFAGM